MRPGLPTRAIGGDVPVAASPTRGQGIALDLNGKLPISAPVTAVQSVTADPADVSTGVIWLRSDLNQFRMRLANGSIATFLPAARGLALVSWPGGATLSSGTTVTHGLSTTPTSVVATMNTIVGGVAVVCAIQVVNIGATTFQVFAQTIDGSTPAAASSIDVCWQAL